MKKVSKIIALLLVVCAVFAFASCGATETSSVDDTSSVVSEDVAKKVLNIKVDNLGEKKEMEIKFEGETLYDALKENNLIDGSNGDYGFFVTAFDGVVADGSDGSYWMFKDANGEYFPSGVETTKINDGDTVNIVREKY